ncbi:hypothetical protein SAMD00019534_064000 [Acytostelium subglobosum LB1]|uniref:hypothetical protein n=1 Tax=Acytostelium subglobosum LB1 TaxID=1410327 RepID=UPI000644A765|nr:hypothetical protein SAMD00019534_064000 [Acytostelium subglobosum LB1]GAM23225.1 hypothetical protein SAMD00019534_064000 [Acytostelium subglobosum LB1]|eukprot:XP_012753674.1 hypothetical protein SAMD00019534_064000 [Acytostelium subglobosum LB1]
MQPSLVQKHIKTFSSDANGADTVATPPSAPPPSQHAPNGNSKGTVTTPPRRNEPSSPPTPHHQPPVATTDQQQTPQKVGLNHEKVWIAGNGKQSKINAHMSLALPSSVSPRLLPLAKGIMMMKRNNEIKNNKQKRSLPNIIESNNEMLKLFNAVQSILIALPGISPTVVMGIMDTLYGQHLKLDFSTFVDGPYFDGLVNAIQTLGAWTEQQEYVRNVIKVQSCVRRFLAKKRYERLKVYSSSVQLKERNIAFRHLYFEERRYIDNLEIILSCYYKPLKSSSLLSDDNFKDIFSSIEEIHAVHKKMLAQFEQLHNKWPCIEGVGDIFLRMAPELRVYGNYVKNFKNAIDTLERCKNNNHKFAAFLTDCVESNLNNSTNKVFDLMALIATPLNHLSVYQRQLCVISTNTPINRPDLPSINNAMTMMKEIEQLIQDNLAQAQNAATLINIYRMMHNKKALDPFVIPGRTYLHEGRLTKFVTKKPDRVYHYYLCNDIIVFCKKTPKEKELKFKSLLHLSEVTVSDQTDNANHKNIISILQKGGVTYFFQVDDAEEKKRLLKQFALLCTTTERLFGVSLHDLVQREGPNVLVPAFIIKSFNILLNHTDVEGLFRISPNQYEVDHFKESLNQCTFSGLDALLAKQGPHHIAAVIKNFFRDTTPPLLTYELFNKIVELADSDDESSKKVQTLRSMLSTIPPCHQATLQMLLLFLRFIGQNSDVNKMTYSNLAIVFGPNLVKPVQQTIETSLKIPLINNVITMMLNNYQLIYKERLNSIKVVDSKFKIEGYITTK